MSHRLGGSVWPATLLALGSVTLVAAPAGARPVVPSPCQAHTASTAFPDTLLLGETTAVTLQVHADCPGVSIPTHVVFALDESGAMAGEPNRSLRATVGKIIEELELPKSHAIKVGIVGFNDSARTICRMTADEEKLLDCVARAEAKGGSAIDRGATEGLRVLRAGRVGAQAWAMPSEVLIVVSDGQNDGGDRPVRSALRKAKEQSVLIMTLCASRRCDESAMRDWATSPRFFYLTDELDRLLGRIDMIRSGDIWLSLRRLTISYTLAPDVDLVDGGAFPPPTVAGEPPILTWVTDSVPREGVTVTFLVRPRTIGHRPVGAGAGAAFIDNQNRRGSAAIPVPSVWVFRAERDEDYLSWKHGSDTPRSAAKEPSP